MENKNLLAIIGDIIDSKSIKNRGEIQRELKKVLEKMNMDYRKYIVSNWTITLGDEFQVLI